MSNTNEQKVWVSSLIREANNYYIALGFPHIDYKRQFVLDIKRYNSQVVGTDVIFTAEEEAELKKLSNLESEALKGEGNYQGIQIMPDKLWTSDVNTPTKKERDCQVNCVN